MQTSGDSHPHTTRPGAHRSLGGQSGGPRHPCGSGDDRYTPTRSFVCSGFALGKICTDPLLREQSKFALAGVDGRLRESDLGERQVSALTPGRMEQMGDFWQVKSDGQMGPDRRSGEDSRVPINTGWQIDRHDGATAGIHRIDDRRLGCPHGSLYTRPQNGINDEITF